MNKEKGWISLYRQFVDWEWYDDANTMRLFIHCLLMANYEDKKWRGKLIKRGSFITSQSKLAHSLKLSIMQIRNSLKKLKSTGEITVQASPEYSVISIKNYNQYQDDNRLKNKRITPREPTNNQRVTTTNNINKDISNIYNIHTHKEKSVCENSKNISSEDLKILKAYAKESGAKNISAYVHKLIENKGYIEILKEEKERQERKKRRLGETQQDKQEKEIEETPEERAQILQMVKDRVTQIRKGENQ